MGERLKSRMGEGVGTQEKAGILIAKKACTLGGKLRTGEE